MIYVDTSALIKTVLAEEHSAACEAYLDEHENSTVVSSVLTVIETRRAVLRESPVALPRADLALSRIGKVDLAPAVIESASLLPDASLRSLDAVHVASALLLGADLTAFVTYDKKLLASAAALGLPAVRPT